MFRLCLRLQDHHVYELNGLASRTLRGAGHPPCAGAACPFVLDPLSWTWPLHYWRLSFLGVPSVKAIHAKDDVIVEYGALTTCGDSGRVTRTGL